MTLEYQFNNDNPDFDTEERWREIFHLLGHHQCEVTFTKVDGSVRTMPCTLKSELLPARELKEHHSTKAINYKTLSVWCLDKSEWRSFRTANVTHIRVME
jgi:WYL_2, Sm-like SH3 beta-barrel fold